MTDQRDRDGPLVETANEVRQGPKGKPVLWVLVVGLGLALIALFYFMSTSVEDPPPSIGVQEEPVGQQPVGPSTDAVPGNTEPGQLDPPPDPQK